MVMRCLTCGLEYNGETQKHDCSDRIDVPLSRSEQLRLAQVRCLDERTARGLQAGTNMSNDSQKRKGQPVFTGVLMYFPDALLAISEHSRKGGEKHAPGQPLHWAKDKSKDHADCVARHLLDIGPDWTNLDDETGSYHATALAWRALALLQTVIDRKKNDNGKG